MSIVFPVPAFPCISSLLQKTLWFHAAPVRLVGLNTGNPSLATSSSSIDERRPVASPVEFIQEGTRMPPGQSANACLLGVLPRLPATAATIGKAESCWLPWHTSSCICICVWMGLGLQQFFFFFQELQVKRFTFNTTLYYWGARSVHIVLCKPLLCFFFFHFLIKAVAYLVTCWGICSWNIYLSVFWTLRILTLRINISLNSDSKTCFLSTTK